LRRFALDIGHSPTSPGAVLRVNGNLHATEHAFNASLVPLVAQALRSLGAEAEVFSRVGGSVEETRRINSYRANAVVSFHCNADPDPDGPEDRVSSGTMALHWPGSVLGQALARPLSAAVARTLGIPDRGAVAQDRSWAAVGKDAQGRPVPAGPFLYILHDTIAPAVILESFFIDNATDYAAGRRTMEDGALPAVIARTLLTWGM